MNLNKVFLIGRLTRDPEVKVLPSGQQVASFGLATDRYYQDKNGQKQQKTEFHNIVVFGRLSQIAAQYLTKGSLAMIEGRIQTRSWQNSAGQKINRTEIIAERMQLGPKSLEKVNQNNEEQVQKEEIPVIEEEEIDIKDIPL
jgi:single-strand DNA-binding protein